MKDQSSEPMREKENVVTFPSKGKISGPSAEPDHNDPLDLLLNEFSDLVDQMEPEFDTAPVPDFELNQELEMSPRDRISYKLDKLADVSKRLKFYIDDVETFLPRFKK